MKAKFNIKFYKVSEYSILKLTFNLAIDVCYVSKRCLFPIMSLLAKKDLYLAS